jgi:hypothetical protein
MQFSDPGWVSICALLAGVRILSRSPGGNSMGLCGQQPAGRTDSKRWCPQDICPKKTFVLRKRWRGCKLSGGEGRLGQAVNDAGHWGSGGRAFSLENEIELPVVALHIGREIANSVYSWISRGSDAARWKMAQDSGEVEAAKEIGLLAGAGGNRVLRSSGVRGVGSSRSA